MNRGDKEVEMIARVLPAELPPVGVQTLSSMELKKKIYGWMEPATWFHPIGKNPGSTGTVPPAPPD
jgi:hypothetical protein